MAFCSGADWLFFFALAKINAAVCSKGIGLEEIYVTKQATLSHVPRWKDIGWRSQTKLSEMRKGFVFPQKGMAGLIRSTITNAIIYKVKIEYPLLQAKLFALKAKPP